MSAGPREDDGNVVALQYLLDWTEGDVPFKEIPKLGGPKIMRGYVPPDPDGGVSEVRYAVVHAPRVKRQT